MRDVRKWIFFWLERPGRRPRRSRLKQNLIRIGDMLWPWLGLPLRPQPLDPYEIFGIFRPLLSPTLWWCPLNSTCNTKKNRDKIHFIIFFPFKTFDLTPTASSAKTAQIVIFPMSRGSFLPVYFCWGLGWGPSSRFWYGKKRGNWCTLIYKFYTFISSK